MITCLSTNVLLAQQQQISAQEVLRAIERGKQFLVSQQLPDGSWHSSDQRYKEGVTSLVTLSLINSGMTKDDAPIKKALRWLRSVRDPEPAFTYETALMIMALAAAKDGATDQLRILKLAQKLENSQVQNGRTAGSWDYTSNGPGNNGDHSISQFALLGLREAAHAGIEVDKSTWQRAHNYWLLGQNGDGGWGYGRGQADRSTGSMTAAGIAALVITEEFLQEERQVDQNGDPICCRTPDEKNELKRALDWMARNFRISTNPYGQAWLLYYLYGVERAGRLSGQRFFGKSDWYRLGVRFLLSKQIPRTGGWRGLGHLEDEPVVGTALSLLFLSKGLSPVLINKLQFGPQQGQQDLVPAKFWNKHPRDIRNLTDYVSGLKSWPSLVTWQVVDLETAVNNNALDELLQAPVLYLAGDTNLAELRRPESLALLREYIAQGGFIFAVANCESPQFDAGIREFVNELYPELPVSLAPLPPTHAVYRSEYNLDPGTVKLEGVEVGCRTAIIYSPEDVSCLWDKWTIQTPSNRPNSLTTAIAKSMRIGVNVIAYATGRELRNKLETPDLIDQLAGDQIERGYLRIAKIRHSGDWDAAPQAVRYLFAALRKTSGVPTPGTQQNLPLSDPKILRYPLIYMHGLRQFRLNPQERQKLKEYLSNGGVLFADACCGSPRFDESFREAIKDIFPEQELERIPAQHELFTSQVGHSLKTVTRRGPTSNAQGQVLEIRTRVTEPYLEGIMIDGRYAVIYSKYDISCALERQTSVACEGYLPEDAAKIAVNVVLYAILQDAVYKESDIQ